MALEKQCDEKLWKSSVMKSKVWKGIGMDQLTNDLRRIGTEQDGNALAKEGDDLVRHWH